MKRNFLNKKRAQELVEFAIIVPILMMILFIIVEFGSALNARITVGDAVKIALVKVNNLSSLNGTEDDKKAFVENYVKREVIKYLILHNIPNSGSVKAKVKVVNGKYAVILVSYSYHPYFIIAGLLGHGVDTIPFSSSQTLNPHIFEANVLPQSFTTTELSEFHTATSGDSIESGALVDGYYDNPPGYDVREHTAFLLHFYGGVVNYPNLQYDKARLVSWQGNDLLPPNLRINLKTGTLEVRSPYYHAGVWFDTKIPYIWVVSAMGINHLIFTKYNSYQMLLADNSALLYKLRFNSTDPFYNRDIIFCGIGSCSGDQRGTATVNERALRMNPLLGDPSSANNGYIIGTMEPIYVPGSASAYYHNLKFVNSYYFSYTADFLHWASADWYDQDFITISSPHVLGLNNTMANGIYISDITNPAKNPFYTPYKYRLKMCEVVNSGNCTAGTYVKDSTWDYTEDGNIDANNNAGWDDVEPSGDHFYTMDIVDVYTDSDGDGIPDAWDRDPAFPDANVNGILDGNETEEINYSVTTGKSERCNDINEWVVGGGMPHWAKSAEGEPLDYKADSAICAKFPNIIKIGNPIYGVISGHIVAPTDFTDFYASQQNGNNYSYYAATPYKVTLAGTALNSLESPGYITIPEIKLMDLVIYSPDGGITKAIYYKIDDDHYTRVHPSWWEELPGCSANPNDKFSQCNVKARRTLKAATYIHGSTLSTDIVLDPSDELQYLYTNVFSPILHVRRTPPSNVW